MAAQSATTPVYRVSTSSLAHNDLNERPHPLNTECKRNVLSLGDACGLTKEGVHFCRVDPHITTTVLHWHNNDDEWCYILEAGEAGATLLVYSEGEAETKEETVHKGDFLGFPAGRRIAHALRAGDHELVYLVGGTRQVMDVCTYPREGKRLVVDRTRAATEGNELSYIEEKHIEHVTLGK